jgi:ABC-type transport system substrate-binding protein
MAIDKELLANEILAGLAVPAKGVIPPTMKGYNQNLKGLGFDPDEARALLDEAGGPELLEGVTLLTPGRGAAPGDILDAIVAMWTENLGVDIQVEQQDFGLFLQTLDDHDFQMFSLGWVADYPDPQNFLDIKLHSQSRNNETQYANPEVDQLLDQARLELDEAARLELYQQAEEIIVEESPWVPLYHGNSALLVKPHVDGYSPTPFVIENLRFVSIEE